MGYLNEDGLATLVGKVKGQVVQLTSAEYRNLPASKNSDNKTYFVTDEDYAYAIDDQPTLNSDNLVKSGGVYTYTSKIGSGTLTTTAQTIIPAINELKSGLTINDNKLLYIGEDNRTTNSVLEYAKSAPLGISFFQTNATATDNPANGSFAFIVLRFATGRNVYGLRLANYAIYENISADSGNTWNGWRSLTYTS